MNKSDFPAAIEPLLGARIGHAWKGYGSAIFLELGDLEPPESETSRHPSGQWSISVYWDWRVELGTSVLFGSSNTGAEIAERLPEIENSTVQSIDLLGDVPELLVTLSTAHRIRTSVMVTGDPEWVIKLNEQERLSVKNGLLTKSNSKASVAPIERQVFDHESETAKRWAAPIIEPAVGSCFQCKFLVRLSGHAYLLDYGVCSAPDSQLDGKVVKRASGCPKFEAK